MFDTCSCSRSHPWGKVVLSFFLIAQVNQRIKISSKAVVGLKHRHLLVFRDEMAETF